MSKMLTYGIDRAGLTVNEVARMINDTRELHYQIFILTAYRLGLRLNETLILRVGNSDNKRMKNHIRMGTGKKCRFVNLFTQTFRLCKPIDSLITTRGSGFSKSHQNIKCDLERSSYFIWLSSVQRNNWHNPFRNQRGRGRELKCVIDGQLHLFQQVRPLLVP